LVTFLSYLDKYSINWEYKKYILFRINRGSANFFLRPRHEVLRVWAHCRWMALEPLVLRWSYWIRVSFFPLLLHVHLDS
jgi:hypothetical protein